MIRESGSVKLACAFGLGRAFAAAWSAARNRNAMSSAYLRSIAREGADAGGVAVDQQPQHQPRIAGRVTALLGVAGPDRCQVQHLVNEVSDEPGEVILGQPVVQRLW
jgi:hypothetical protein